MNNIHAVIFDMDGLLMDSEGLGVEGIRESARLQGVEIPAEIVRRCIGITAKASSDLYHTFWPHLDTDRLFRDFLSIMHEKALRGEIPLKKGAMPLLQYLQAAGIPAAVASSSRMETIRTYLDSVQVTGFFRELISASGIPSKPAPDVFLLAAERLGVKPAECLVLEDSYNGVKAGRAAGMQVCMVPDQLPYTEELSPFVDHVLPDLNAVMELMKK
ncbi:MAG: HAD family phosphatase [Clostridia bacterium]|nr:HAD family phosphatase [Clostridia bacterium]